MKQILSILTVFLLPSSVSFAQTAVQLDNGPVISVDKDVHNYGELEKGGDPYCEFTITNKGNEPLIISNAQGSCGCTVPDWPRNLIAPGEQGEIKVSFNSSGRQGKHDKQVHLNAHTIPNTRVLKITSSVLPNPNKANTAQ